VPKFQHGLTGAVKEVSDDDAAWYREHPPWYPVPATLPESPEPTPKAPKPKAQHGR